MDAMDWVVVVVFLLHLAYALRYARMAWLRRQWLWMALFAVLAGMNAGIVVATVRGWW